MSLQQQLEVEDLSPEQVQVNFETAVIALTNSQKLKDFILSLGAEKGNEMIAQGESFLEELDSTLNEG
ncbi:MAG: hypothetical protein ABIM99_05165 [Candidatus Dojkabacteria bacterium]